MQRPTGFRTCIYGKEVPWHRAWINFTEECLGREPLSCAGVFAVPQFQDLENDNLSNRAWGQARLCQKQPLEEMEGISSWEQAHISQVRIPKWTTTEGIWTCISTLMEVRRREEGKKREQMGWGASLYLCIFGYKELARIQTVYSCDKTSDSAQSNSL